jgi:hypothetical protein
MKKESTLSKKLASYSALASTVLMVSKIADAQIMYTDVNPDDTAHVVGSYLLDLNNDGATDFQFNLILSGNNDLIRVVGSGSDAVLVSSHIPYAGYYYANTLDANALIGGSASWGSKAILASFFASTFFGNWVNVSDRFLGLKLVVNSNTFYGWARLSVNQACDQLIISDYAVDTVANEIIAAGDKCGNYSVYATTVINPFDSVPLCEGSNITLATDSIGGFTYQWLVDDSVITGANSFNYTVDSTGNYSVIVTNSYGCVDTATATQVTLAPLPAIPVISQLDELLISTSASSYQWYENNVIIPGATNQNYAPFEQGDYTVQITDANGCTSISDPYTFIPIGISSPEHLYISVFEANHIVFVQLNDKTFLDGQIKIWNALGENVYTSIVKTESLQIDLSNMSAGIYLLTIEKTIKNIARKIVIH